MSEVGDGQRTTLATSPDAFGVWSPADADVLPWPQFLRAAAAAGYSSVELGPYGYLPTTGSELADALAQHNLRMAGGYVVGSFHTPDPGDELLQELVDVAALTKAVGAENLVIIARAPSKTQRRDPLDTEGWRLMTANLLRINRQVAEAYGLRLVYHPHRDMAVETRGETERLIEDTRGEVAICMDVGQYQSTDGDPVAFIREHRDLVRHIHIRDLQPAVLTKARAGETSFHQLVKDGLFCDPGEGEVDLDGVSAALQEVAYDGPIVVERSPLGASLDQAQVIAARSAQRLVAAGIGRIVPRDD